MLWKVSRSAYYAARTAGPSRHAREDQDLAEAIAAVHDESDGTYGVPRVHAELAAQGRRHSRKRIGRLMRADGRRGRTPKRWRTTTVSDPAATPPADLIRRDFATTTSGINARWCGDITYIPTWEGRLYLATVIDLTSRRVVGWATADLNWYSNWRPQSPWLSWSVRCYPDGSSAEWLRSIDIRRAHALYAHHRPVGWPLVGHRVERWSAAVAPGSSNPRAAH